eukprot:scaffold102456_cov45-Phaeocystis_antarctica.AAC.1
MEVRVRVRVRVRARVRVGVRVRVEVRVRVSLTWVELKKMPLGGAFRKRCGRAASTPEMKAMVFSC